MPAAQDLLLAEDGTLTFGFAGESGRPQVADLADLLERLLSGVTAPQSLLDLAHENARPEPAHTTLAGFCRALKFYERPNRAADLAAVAGRVAGAEPPAGSSPDVPVPAPVVPPPPVPEERKPPTASFRAIQTLQALRVSRGELAVAASAIALIVIFVLAGALMGSRSTSDPNGQTLGPGSSPKPPAPAAAIVSPVTGSGQASPIGGTPQDHPLRPRRVRAPRVMSQTSATTGLSGKVSRPLSRADAVSQSVALPPPSGQFPVVAWTQPDPRVYSADDPGVKPPKMLRQLLPDVAPEAASGYLEVVVDAQGYVESVRLISSATRLQDFGLVAAAKAWKFSPALLNGRPVRCRMRVPIPLDGPPE